MNTMMEKQTIFHSTKKDFMPIPRLMFPLETCFAFCEIMFTSHFRQC